MSDCIPKNQKKIMSPAPIDVLRTPRRHIYSGDFLLSGFSSSVNGSPLLHSHLSQSHAVFVAAHEVAYDEQNDNDRRKEA